jgi:hypothetical protein
MGSVTLPATPIRPLPLTRSGLMVLLARAPIQWPLAISGYSMESVYTGVEVPDLERSIGSSDGAGVDFSSGLRSAMNR